MKIIVSHDIDHLYWDDHLTDTWWPGLYRRTLIDLFKRNLQFKTALKRLLPGGRLHHLPEICDFINEKAYKPTFFVGVSNGLNLSYSERNSLLAIEFLQSQKIDVELHGISYNDPEKMLFEKERFKALSGKWPEGIRTHYLRLDHSSLDLIQSLGYKFDSSLNYLGFPIKINGMMSIPVSIMDVAIIPGYNSGTFEDAVKKTEDIISQAQSLRIPYFVINFHDIYFSKAYPVHFEWFIWLISYLYSSGFEFVTFKGALESDNY